MELQKIINILIDILKNKLYCMRNSFLKIEISSLEAYEYTINMHSNNIDISKYDSKKCEEYFYEELKKLNLELDNKTKISFDGFYINITNTQEFKYKLINDRIYKNYIEENSTISKEDDLYLKNNILLEYGSPNTNKPLHLGHLRNIAIGKFYESLYKDSKHYSIIKKQIYNDRGIHICKAMLAYKLNGNNETPISTGMKGDHFVGKWYVEYSKLEDSDFNKYNTMLRKMLSDWEEKDAEVMELWSTMRNWAISGIEETYKKLDVSFDKTYNEHEIYQMGKDIVYDEADFVGNFKRQEDGSIIYENEKKIKKVLVRSDGTSLYITQDIALALISDKEYPNTGIIYITAVEQEEHFNALRHILNDLGKLDVAKKIAHVSYGMVNLLSGKMKSRQGSTVDVDDLFNFVESEIKNICIEKNSKATKSDIEIMAYTSIFYYLLKTPLNKDIVFIPEDSITMKGNSGMYMMNAYIRAKSVIEKRNISLNENEYYKELINKVKYEDLKAIDLNIEEKNLIKELVNIDSFIENLEKTKDPSYAINKLNKLSSLFHKFYNDHKIFDPSEKSLLENEMRKIITETFIEVIEKICNKIGLKLPNKM